MGARAYAGSAPTAEPGTPMGTVPWFAVGEVREHLMWVNARPTPSHPGPEASMYIGIGTVILVIILILVLT